MIYNGEHGIHGKRGDFIKFYTATGYATGESYYQHGMIEKVYPLEEWETDDELYVIRDSEGNHYRLSYSNSQTDIILARMNNE